MIRILSLDAILDAQAESDLDGDDMTVNTCSQQYINAVLESVPDEGTRDLVDLIASRGLGARP